MTRCSDIRKDLTALADGALTGAEAERLRDHLQTCGDCRRELRSIERTVHIQQSALALPLPELSLGFETRLRQKLAEANEVSPGWAAWLAWIWKPLAVAAVTATAILVAAGPLGGPSTVLVPLGLQSPPPKLAKETELFQDYPIIEHLDEFENFESVEAIPLDENGKRKGAG